MKIMIIGLGNFGKSLALYLTNNGHEVFGIDNYIEKVDHLKEEIFYTICMDATNELLYKKSLPINQIKIAIVTIGQNEGDSIIVTAILKKYKHLNIMSRSISDIHYTILTAMDIYNIFHPEQEAAFILTKKIFFNYTLDYFEINDKYSIAEVVCPKYFIGKSVRKLDLLKKYKISLITIIYKNDREKNIKKITPEVSGLITGDTIIPEGSTLVIFGLNNSIMNIIINNLL